jgi:putative transposase
MAQILRAASEEQIEISAHCFMPDHVHLLVSAKSPASNARRFINRARQFSGYAFAEKYKVRLWQRYGYDHVLREDDAVFSMVRYIVENPVRAGLVARIEDYPFTGFQMCGLEDILEGIKEAGPTKRQLLAESIRVRLKPDTT